MCWRVLQSGDSLNYVVKCSCLEVYNDKIFDLLQEHTGVEPGSLNLMQDDNNNVIVNGLHRIEVWLPIACGFNVSLELTFPSNGSLAWPKVTVAYDLEGFQQTGSVKYNGHTCCAYLAKPSY